MSQLETGTLKHGFMFNGQPQFEFEMAPVERAGQIFDAEVEAGGFRKRARF